VRAKKACRKKEHGCVIYQISCVQIRCGPLANLDLGQHSDSRIAILTSRKWQPFGRWGPSLGTEQPQGGGFSFVLAISLIAWGLSARPLRLEMRIPRAVEDASIWILLVDLD
jgi:hypothetical protein